jgi:hypothetical protein
MFLPQPVPRELVNEALALAQGRLTSGEARTDCQTTERHTAMTPRLNPHKAAPETMKALVALENYVQESGLDHSLIDLVKTRLADQWLRLLHPYA